ncbi:hypothetical protein HDU67_001573 [Dinochytrium kinnereticum]|nr:hypothetical protein HDU67_001573 [Dinochytrium kinnereticum]
MSSTVPLADWFSLPWQKQDVFHQITDPQTGKTFFANTMTGDCSWEKPAGAIIVQKDPSEQEWWELFDEQHKLPYYYNTKTGETEWLRPDNGIVIPNSSIGKRMSIVTKRTSVLGMGGNEESLRTGPSRGSTGLAQTRGLSSSDGGLNTSQNGSVYSQSAPTSYVGSAVSISNIKGSSGGIDIRPNTNSSGSAAEAWKSAMSKGISNPVPNPEAAASMNPLSLQNRSLSQPLSSKNNQNLASLPKVKRELTKILPDDLKRHINQFRIDGFAKKYFSEHRKGIFRRKVPVEKMLVFQKETLKTPLMVLSKNLRPDALKCFRVVQKVMSDLSPGPPYRSTLKDIQFLLEKGIMQGGLRDEIYVQICKQVNKNPSFESTFRGWVLLCVITIAFPPSKNFEDYMRSFTHQHFDTSPSSPRLSPEGEKIALLARHCDKKLMRICKAGPRGKTPTLHEIERAQEAPFTPALFGETLEDIMANQDEMIKNANGRPSSLPRILPFLVDAILSLNGCKTEGIFRVPGDADMVNGMYTHAFFVGREPKPEPLPELRCRIEKGNHDLSGISDPNVPSSLLKFWLRDLADPLIPSDLYDACIKIGAEESRPDAAIIASNIVAALPEINRRVVLYLIKFLKIVGDPSNQPITRMTIANIAMVFAPNFLRCPRFEQAFLRILMTSASLEDVSE